MPRKLFAAGLALTVLGLAAFAQVCLAADGPIVQVGVAGDCGVVADGCCAAACCQKICVPTVETKKTSKRVYSDVCEDFCLPPCLHCLSLRRSCDSGCGECGDCGGCGGSCVRCGKVHTKKYLVVRVRETEECDYKCVVQQQCCPTAQPCGQPMPASPMPAPSPKKAEVIYQSMPQMTVIK